ncbi:MAG: flagellar type III secretion system pore protein FliP [Planctomycetota bacterium]
MRRILFALALAVLAAALSAPAAAQGPAAPAGPPQAAGPSPIGDGPQVGEALAAKVRAASAAERDGTAAPPASAGAGDGRLSTAVEIAVLLTILSLLPAVLITLTSFTRIVIVLSFVRRALSLNELPPNPVLIGLALFLTIFVMAPVGKELYAEAWQPYDTGEIQIEEASGRAWTTMSTFLVANTREGELRLFAELAGNENALAFAAAGDDVVLAGEKSVAAAPKPSDLPITVVVPAFILSELKTAFQMGFLLFLPFLVIDLVVSSILLSMGMFMLPPVMISTPIKVLLFVLVDGWRLVTESVVTSFMQVTGS